MRPHVLSLTSWLLPAIAPILLTSCGGGSYSSVTSSTQTPTAMKASVVYASETTFDSALHPHSAIEAYTLNTASGAISPVSGSPFQTYYSASGDMALLPNRAIAYQFVFKALPGTPNAQAVLLTLALDPTTGQPSIKQKFLVGNNSGSGSIAVHPSGKFVYISQDNVEGRIGIYAVQDDGTLVARGSMGSGIADNVVITPNGTFLYTISGGGPVGNWQGDGNLGCGPELDYLSGFSIDGSSGVLTPLAGSPFPYSHTTCVTNRGPSGVRKQIDPASARLFTVDLSSGQISAFTIDSSTGALTQLPGSSDSGGSSTAVTLDPNGSFLYVGGPGFLNGLQASGSSTNAVLPAVPNLPLSTNPLAASVSVAIDPTGNFLFSNEMDYIGAFGYGFRDGLAEYRIDPSSGAVTQIQAPASFFAGNVSKIVITAAQ